MNAVVQLKGVVVPVATPLTVTGEPDLTCLQRLVRFLLDAGVHGLFANGSMGAFALLTDAQQAAVIDTVASTANGRVPVLAGVSDTGTVRVLDKIRQFRYLPVDVFVALPPFFFPCNQEELAGFYHDLADFSPKPIVLYDNPRLAGNSLTATTIAALSRHPNIAGIKLSASEPQLWQEILSADLPRDRFSLICGAGRSTNLALRLGFDGITEGLHNVIPSRAVALYAAASRCDFDEADRLQFNINRCFEIFDIAGGWRGLEIALRALGLADYAAPAPYNRSTDAALAARIGNVIENEGIAPPPLARSGAVK